MQYPVTSLVTIGSKSVGKIQPVHNIALRFVYSQWCLYTLNTIQLNELAVLKLIIITRHDKAHTIMERKQRHDRAHTIMERKQSTYVTCYKTYMKMIITAPTAILESKTFGHQTNNTQIININRYTLPNKLWYQTSLILTFLKKHPQTNYNCNSNTFSI